jgi:hypothetical protein
MNICTECKNKFEVKRNSTGKFCSRSCSAKTNNRLYPKKFNLNKLRECINCDSKLKKSQSKYCSRKCSGEKPREDLIKLWLEDKDSGSDSNGTLRAVFRRYLIKEANYKCSECGWDKPNPITKTAILTVDHVDGNWKNNKFDNLKVICYNCHTLTVTFGSLNKNGMSYERLLQQRKSMAMNAKG